MHSVARHLLTCTVALAVLCSTAACGRATAGAGTTTATVPAATAPAAAPAAGRTTGLSLVLVTARPQAEDRDTATAITALTAVADELGADLDVLQSTSPDEVERTVTEAVEIAPDLVLGLGDETLPAIDGAAATNLDQQFLLLDATPAEPTDNLTSVVFREHETSYLTGVEAALLTTSGTVGLLAPQDDVWSNGWTQPFTDGARSVSDDVTVAVGYANAAADISAIGVRGGVAKRAATAAAHLAGTGADVLQQVALGRSGDLLPLTAGAGTLAGSDALVLGSEYGPADDGCALAPGRVADTVVERIDVVARAGIEAVASGQTGTTTSYGLAEGALALASLDGSGTTCVATSRPAVVSAVTAARDAIVAGTVAVADPDVEQQD